MPRVEPGDIVVKYRPKYEGAFNYLLQRLVCFFTTEWWRKEETSKAAHAEMVYSQIDEDNYTVIDQEPPQVRFKNRSFNRRIIFRLKIKPPLFNNTFYEYVKEMYGTKYDFVRFFCFAIWWIFLQWNFLSKMFSRWFYKTPKSVCSVFVARFYQDRIGISCSTQDAEMSSPDDVYDYCLSHPGQYMVVSDNY